MIKGVNKKVLEINNPQSLYFEKAVLYLCSSRVRKLATQGGEVLF